MQTRPVTRRVFGVDLGKLSDYTALTVLHSRPGTPAPPTVKPPDALPAAAAQRRPVRPPGSTHDVLALKRWRLGTSYHTIAEWIVNFVQSPDVALFADGPAPVLAVDETGVGTAVTEIFYRALRRAGARVILLGITITAGKAVSHPAPNRWRVAKMELAGVLIPLFEGGRLNIAPVPDRELLIREAQEFTLKVTPAGNETMESFREGAHDDLVLSLCLSCWVAERWPQWPDWPPPVLPAGWRA